MWAEPTPDLELTTRIWNHDCWINEQAVQRVWKDRQLTAWQPVPPSSHHSGRFPWVTTQCLPTAALCRYQSSFLFHNIPITYVTTTSCSCWHGTHSTASNISNNSRKSHAVYRNLRNIYVKPSVWSWQLFIPVYFTSVEFDDDVSSSAYSTFFV